MSKAVKEIKDKLSAVFEAEPAVGLVYLFGSQASGLRFWNLLYGKKSHKKRTDGFLFFFGNFKNARNK